MEEIISLSFELIYYTHGISERDISFVLSVVSSHEKELHNISLCITREQFSEFCYFESDLTPAQEAVRQWLVSIQIPRICEGEELQWTYMYPCLGGAADVPIYGSSGCRCSVVAESPIEAKCFVREACIHLKLS